MLGGCVSIFSVFSINSFRLKPKDEKSIFVHFQLNFLTFSVCFSQITPFFVSISLSSKSVLEYQCTMVFFFNRCALCFWFDFCVYFFYFLRFLFERRFCLFSYISHTFATAYATTNEFVRQILYYAIFQFNFYMVMDNTCLFEFGNALISSNLQYLYSVFFLFVCHNFTSYVVFHL